MKIFVLERQMYHFFTFFQAYGVGILKAQLSNGSYKYSSRLFSFLVCNCIQVTYVQSLKC